jgi:hypothetical protein
MLQLRSHSSRITPRAGGGQAGVGKVRRSRSGGDARYATCAINSAGPGQVESDLPMKTKTYFVFRVDIWDDAGDNIVEHVAGADDFQVAEAIYKAAIARWPMARITLRQGIRVVHDSGQSIGQRAQKGR